MSIAQPDSLIGSVLGGRYEIVARINRGGTAVVYRAIDRRLGRTVAVKVIHSDLSGDTDYVKRFDREARAAAILSHPNIVAVFDQGFTGERPYIVMEFVRGQSLRAIITSSAPLPPTLALSYADEVAKAVAAAHDAGIIHRDIKPENVLITNDGQVKVTDFGLAKTITSQTSTASQGMLMGTMSYIAPEIPANGVASKASDVYSTGIVLYEMLTGKKPHVGEELSQVLLKHMNEDVPPPSKALSGSARARIPDYVDALVTACTSRDPGVRLRDGRVLQQMISKARRSLEAGNREDPDLVRELLDPSMIQGNTPSIPIVIPRDTPSREDTPVQSQPPAKKLTQAASRKPAKAPQIKEHRKIPRAVLILGIVVLLAIIGIGWWILFGQWTKVPVMAGLSEPDARTLAAANSLQIDPIREYSETVLEGLVIRTEPAEGSRVHRDDTITIVISRGPERYPMPKVVGLLEEAAVDAIKSAHLAIGTITEVWSEKAPVGEVVSASQKEGASLKPNTKIDLSVSKGREPIPIISYVGKTQAEATKALQDAGFTVKISEDFSVKIPKGSVAAQKPDKGTGYRGDSIELVISKGPRMVTIPDVFGLRRSEAITKLSNAGFIVDPRVENPMGTPLQIANGTTPKAGEMAAEGSTIILHLV